MWNKGGMRYIRHTGLVKDEMLNLPRKKPYLDARLLGSMRFGDLIGGRMGRLQNETV